MSGVEFDAMIENGLTRAENVESQLLEGESGFDT